MASSVCAFAVSPAPATSFISPPLYRTSRQWRCVYSARQQKEPVRRLRKGLARFVVVLADEESDVQIGISRKRPPIAKPTTPRHFSTASVKLRKPQCEQMFSELPLKADIARCSRHVSKVPKTVIQDEIFVPRKNTRKMLSVLL